MAGLLIVGIPYTDMKTALTSAEAGCQLGVGQSAIQRWYKLGLLSGKHDGGQSLLWIYWNEKVEYRLSGKATPDARMVSVRRLCRQQEKCWEEVVAVREVAVAD